jgi:hypothetical protein
VSPNAIAQDPAVGDALSGAGGAHSGMVFGEDRRSDVLWLDQDGSRGWCGGTRVPSGPKRHHFVPRAFLECFGEAERVALRWRTGRDLIRNVKNVAVESGFYEFTSIEGEKSLRFEIGLSDSRDR